MIRAIDAPALLVRTASEDVDFLLRGDSGGYSGGFDGWFRLLAWCILFEPDRGRVHVVIAYLDFRRRLPRHGGDAPVNRMERCLGYPGGRETERLPWPEAYGGLDACFDLPPERRSA